MSDAHCRLLRGLPPGAVVTACLGFSFWKRDFFGRMFSSNGQRPRFCDSAEMAVQHAAATGGAIAVWASREPPGLKASAAERGLTVVSVEDGFLRSAGLGADFILPASVVLDTVGMYYDPSEPSGLERILAGAEWTAELLGRAQTLIQTINERRLTKYNLSFSANAFAPATRRPAILVPGQVVDDQSVMLGGCGIRSNADLLAEVRWRNPSAFVYYKPHPDVVAGHRAGFLSDQEALRHADQVLHDVGILEAVEHVDEVHTLTSLTGFEALLRGKTVVAYGQPFYAGWGLTVDVRPLGRRHRTLTLPELAAGALILYPTYIHPASGEPCEVEDLIALLQSGSRPRQSLLVKARQLQGKIKARLQRARRPSRVRR
jgi:capsular polysaccharide export protein